jgi:hypothetical protein
MEDIIGAVLEGVIELFALSESPKGFLRLLAILLVIGGILYWTCY